MTKKRLSDKVIAITGAGGGLGAATAKAMAAEGAALALTDRDAEGLEHLAQTLRETGAKFILKAGDVRDRQTHIDLHDLAIREFGQIDGLCNVAGILGPGTLEQATTDQFDQVMHVNCLAQLLAIQTFAPSMGRNCQSSIVNVASVGALVGLPLMSVYCASKAAVVGLTKAVAVELAPRIRCNVVCPGGIDTPMAKNLLSSVPPSHRDELLSKLTGRQLLKRFASPEEIAAVLVFLVSDESAFLTGAVLAADGGHTAW